MDGELHDPVFHSPLWESRSDLQFCTTDATLYIPESSVAEFAKKMTEGRGYSIPYSIKVYSGNDVYAAQKAGGAAATKDWCPGHVYTHQIRSADRVYTFANCQTAPRWYYSCAICGKCEYNPNHVSANFKAKPIEKLMEFTHATLYDELATDQAYIGVNAAGMHVYWLSCDVCGRSDRYLQQHLTEKDLTLSGNDSTLEHYQQEVNAALQMRETLALSSTEDQAGMFTLRLRNTAKTSAWAQSDVNFALNDNLLDLDLLGNDYTKNISRLQFCSVVVRLAEEMTGKTITPAAANTFTDTNSPYVLKAYAAGITSGTSATTFSGGGMVISACCNGLIRDYTPAGKAGLFQGIRIVFQVLLPMVTGPYIGAAVIRGTGMTYEDLGTVKQVPTAEIFLAAAAALVLLAIPAALLKRKETVK